MTTVNIEHKKTTLQFKVLHKVGNWYIDNTSSEIYQLVHFGDGCVDLVATNGETYCNCGGIEVANLDHLTAQEWDDIAGPEVSDFVLLKNVNIDYAYA